MPDYYNAGLLTTENYRIEPRPGNAIKPIYASQFPNDAKKATFASKVTQ